MVVFDTSLREIKIHKNRGSKAIKKVSFKFGEYALITSNESKLELIQFALLKRLLKKLIKKKKNKKKNKDGENKMFLKNYKIWLHILPNFAISKKSKNARMGKGKGNFLRWVFRLQQGLAVAEFLGIPLYRIIKVVNYINKKLKLKLIVRSNNVGNCLFPSWTNLNVQILYFRKYRYM